MTHMITTYTIRKGETMKKYIEFKIKKRTMLFVAIILLFIFSCGGYYVWCSYHPEILIGIVRGGRGEEIKAEVPSVSISNRHGIDIAAPVELKLLQFQMQYDHMNEYFIHNFKEADIKLDIVEKDGKTILKYSGTTTDMNNVTENFNEDITLDFVLDATIE